MINKYFSITCMALSVLIGFTFASAVFSRRNEGLFETNVEALTQQEMSDEEAACKAEGGVWNHFSNCEEGGVILVPCTYEGEITVFGVTLHGNYVNGNSYPIYWARYSCEHVAANYCCTKQGIFVGDQQVS